MFHANNYFPNNVVDLFLNNNKHLLLLTLADWM